MFKAIFILPNLNAGGAEKVFLNIMELLKKDVRVYLIVFNSTGILQKLIPKEVKFGLPSALVGMDLSQTLTAPGLGITDIFSAPSLDYLFGLTSRSNEGVVGSLVQGCMLVARATPPSNQFSDSYLVST